MLLMVVCRELTMEFICWIWVAVSPSAVWLTDSIRSVVSYGSSWMLNSSLTGKPMLSVMVDGELGTLGGSLRTKCVASVTEATVDPPLMPTPYTD